MTLIAKNMPIYASKNYSSTEIIEYNDKNYKESKDKCDDRNISWFGSYKVAQQYGKYIRQFETKRQLKLLVITEELFMKFMKTKNLEPLTNIILPKTTYDHPYFHMDTNDRCLYELKVAFGHVSVKEQYEFLKLFDFLLDKNYLQHLTRNKYIIPSYLLKLYYYRINLLKNPDLKNQRLSVYQIDKSVLKNVCRVVSCKYDGIYQSNQENFWNPNFLVFEIFRKDIEEYILFRPQEVLVPIEDIEKYIVDKFIDFFKYELSQPQVVINGGYGIKTLLESRYNVFDVIDTKDIDVMVGGCTSENFKLNMQKWDDKFERFLKMIGNPHIKKYYKDFKGKFYPQFNYNGYKEITISYLGTDLIDVMFTNYDMKETIFDRMHRSSLPLKKLEYYLEDLIKLFYQTNIEGINRDLYKKRNPIYGSRKEKGRKIIERAKLICSFLENKTFCSMIKNITEKDLLKSNDEKKKLFLYEKL